MIVRSDICKDLLQKRYVMGELTKEKLFQYRSYAKKKRAELWELGYEGDDLERKIRYYCGSWLRNKKPSRMQASNKRRRNSATHKTKAKASKYKRQNDSLWGYTEAIWNDYGFADMRRKHPRKVEAKTREQLYEWMVQQLTKQNNRSAYRNERGIYPRMTRIRDGNLSKSENFKNATNISIDQVLPGKGYRFNNMVLCQRQQNKQKNATHTLLTEDVLKHQRKVEKKLRRKK